MLRLRSSKGRRVMVDGSFQPGDEVAWIGYGTRIDGIFGEDDGSGTVMIRRKDFPPEVPMTWQSQKVGDAWFAFSGTKNGESTFDFPIVKVRA